MADIHAVDVFLSQPPVLAADVYIAQGPQGNDGEQGPQGEQGPSGEDGDSFDQSLNTTDSPQFTGLTVQDGLTPTSFDLYNTYTDASNYERGGMRWNGSNVLEIGTEADGTGVQRNIDILSRNTTRFKINGNIVLFIGASSMIAEKPIIFKKPCVPFASDTTTCGEPSRRWKSVYTDTTNQRTESTMDPSTAEYPNDKDSGVHLNTTSGLLYQCHNYNGTIYKTQLT